LKSWPTFVIASPHTPQVILELRNIDDFDLDEQSQGENVFAYLGLGQRGKQNPLLRACTSLGTNMDRLADKYNSNVVG